MLCIWVLAAFALSKTFIVLKHMQTNIIQVLHIFHIVFIICVSHLKYNYTCFWNIDQFNNFVLNKMKFKLECNWRIYNRFYACCFIFKRRMKASTVYEFEDASAHAMADISPHPALVTPNPPDTSISQAPPLVLPRKNSYTISYKVYFVFCFVSNALLTFKEYVFLWKWKQWQKWFHDQCWPIVYMYLFQSNYCYILCQVDSFCQCYINALHALHYHPFFRHSLNLSEIGILGT